MGHRLLRWVLTIKRHLSVSDSRWRVLYWGPVPISASVDFIERQGCADLLDVNVPSTARWGRIGCVTEIKRATDHAAAGCAVRTGREDALLR